MTKLFLCINPVTRTDVIEIRSQTPREAALKAATRNITMIHLVEMKTGKLHKFNGRKVDLLDDEHNTFTQSHNITGKPVVQKIAYRNMRKEFSRCQLDDVCAQFLDM